jgi:hypothetical protein
MESNQPKIVGRATATSSHKGYTHSYNWVFLVYFVFAMTPLLEPRYACQQLQISAN